MTEQKNYKTNKINNVGNMLQRPGKIGMNKKKKNLSMTKTSHILDPEITSLQILYTIYYNINLLYIYILYYIQPQIRKSWDSMENAN